MQSHESSILPRDDYTFNHQGNSCNVRYRHLRQTVILKFEVRQKGIICITPYPGIATVARIVRHERRRNIKYFEETDIE